MQCEQSYPVPRSPEETRHLFDRWASTYDEDLRQPSGPLDGYVQSLDVAVTLLPLAPNAAVLDIGIGTGAFAAMLATRGARIWGLDPSPEMLARCRALHPAFSLAVGSFSDIPHPDEWFDATAASFAFHEVPPGNRPAACAEVVRTLKPGGILCLLDIMFASSAAAAEARTRLGRYWDDQEEYPLVGDLDALLRDAGLRYTRWQQTAPCHWVVLARR
ncbi:MAG TPA: class I SAM-dependent methyltransferase [Chloroflexota bacterium]|nr:class I SAM-dependent methyltransferase [Chloroflexota bacterium]